MTIEIKLVRFLLVAALSLAVSICHSQRAASRTPYPPAPKQTVIDTYHGVEVADEYRWLEDLAKPETQAWVAQQNQLSRTVLDAAPGRAWVRERVSSLVLSNSRSYDILGLRRGTLFAMKTEPPKQQALLVTLASPDKPASEKVVVDPNAMAADGSIAIDWAVPSPDGRLVAVSMSKNGSEDGSLYVFDVATGQKVEAEIPRVQYPTAGGSVAWRPDGKSFYYTRFPAPGERAEADLHFYQQIYLHHIGRPASKDRYILGREFPRIAEIHLESARTGEQLAVVKNGDGGEASVYLLSRGLWKPVAQDADGVKDALFGEDGWLYLLSRKDAPRGKVLRVSLRTPLLAKAQTVLAESEGTLQNMTVTAGRLLVSSLSGGPSNLAAIDLETLARVAVELPAVSSVDSLVKGSQGEVLASIQSYTVPPAWYRVTLANGLEKTALAMTSDADYGDAEVLREHAVSKDGTRVPLNIIRLKGTQLDGSNPTILYGYGGYGVSETPYFSTARRVWLDQGGVFVLANIRGGGEFGDAWHLAGNLTKKQNVFDDFIASAEYLIAKGYTSPKKLAIQGGSNGGLLMGAALTQRPDLFRAVHSSVGIYDMLRAELDPNGAFNVTEFGTVKDKGQFEALFAYSPFHHVRDGAAYPGVLMTTGDNDGRVNPAHSRKMVARLQAANPDGLPILLRTSAASGHGNGTSLNEVIEERIDMFCFFFDQLGVKVKAPK